MDASFEANVCFNPLDRGNLNQIIELGYGPRGSTEFQSPRSGKFESNLAGLVKNGWGSFIEFQSPRSGKFESNY